MPGLVSGIHVFTPYQESKTWMAGTSPAMTRVAAFSICHCHGMGAQFKPETSVCRHSGARANGSGLWPAR
jgi:hypothetical protein